MSTLPIIFKDPSQLITFARDFIVSDRLNSLENDVARCLPQKKINNEEPDPAPFPALMYCFSIIDLLGALYAGNARSRKTIENARKCIESFLKYPQDKLLWQIYRHKLVHLSQPKYAMLHEQKILGWRHNENERYNHLKIVFEEKIVNILPNDMIKVAKLHYDGYYNISIHMLKDDIMDSVTRQPDGYLENLSDSRDLQSKFVTAINQIYDPIITD
jgi:hypothetical protein